MGVNSHIFINGVEICKFKAIYFNINALCLDNVSKDFSTYNMKKTGLYGYLYDFSVHYDSIDVADVVNEKTQ